MNSEKVNDVLHLNGVTASDDLCELMHIREEHGDAVKVFRIDANAVLYLLGNCSVRLDEMKSGQMCHSL